MPTWLIWVIVVIVVIVIAALIVSLTVKRRTAHRRDSAEQLRQEATSQASSLTESQRRTEELRAKADLAKTEAERAQEQAATAAQSHRIEQATYEDKLREADRLDPDVNTRSGDYEPDVWNDERSDTPGSGPRHAAPATPSGPEPTSETTTTKTPTETPPDHPRGTTDTPGGTSAEG